MVSALMSQRLDKINFVSIAGGQASEYRSDRYLRSVFESFVICAKTGSRYRFHEQVSGQPLRARYQL